MLVDSQLNVTKNRLLEMKLVVKKDALKEMLTVEKRVLYLENL